MPLETCCAPPAPNVHTVGFLSVLLRLSILCDLIGCFLYFTLKTKSLNAHSQLHLWIHCKSGQSAYSVVCPQCYWFRKGRRNQVCYGEMAGKDAFLLLDLSWNNISPETVGGHHPARAWLGMRTTQRTSLLRNERNQVPGSPPPDCAISINSPFQVHHATNFPFG